MTNKDIKIIKEIKNLEKESKQCQHKAKANAHAFIVGIKNSQFNNQFTGFNADKLADSSHNVQHRLSVKLLDKAAGLLVKLVNKISDPDDLMGYEGQIMTADHAGDVFNDFDDDPDCASTDTDNINFLENNTRPYVVMVEGGDVAPVECSDIDIELDALKQAE